MKFLKLLTLPLMVFAMNAKADMICKEIQPKSAATKEVIVKTIADIRHQTRYGIEFDYVWKVKVQINELKNGQRTQLQSFDAVATSADVQYNIDAKRKNGVEVWRYFDEENQDGFSMKTADGKTVSYRLNCQDVP